MRPRTARFALIGAAVVATTALIYVRTLSFDGYMYRRRNGPWLFQPPRRQFVNGLFELSPMEAVVWFFILGALAGGLAGVALARVKKRERTFVLAGAGLVGIAGFIFGVVGLDEFCVISGDTGVCSYKSFFGWAIAPIAAVALWIAIGAVIGGILGRWTASATRHREDIGHAV